MRAALCLSEHLSDGATLAALDRLNVHARARGCGKRFIYQAKHLFALLSSAEGVVSARPVAVMAKCRNCDGTGKFISWYEGPTGERCRTCSAKGWVKLCFTETNIQGVKWHHPWFGNTGMGSSLLNDIWGVTHTEYRDAGGTTLTLADGSTRELVFEGVGDWKPNLPCADGAKLRGEKAASLLNIVEEWLLSTPYNVQFASGLGSRFKRDLTLKTAYYSLDLGRIEAPCFLCGATDDLDECGYHTGVNRLSFSMRKCARCVKECPNEFPKDVPEQALTPAVRQWLANPLRQTKREDDPWAA